ncbi:hypothetical protein TCAL_04167 [Tigriopus californicus]|uniref:long-chain-fatty-acid--CoA ligase n=1 Tax=Tigriopus californicus TaxID=6832 RepID=A0A553NS43_TIGCA|nr:hypothetical protein TCAL_04167 [Tigriopus californicus]
MALSKQFWSALVCTCFIIISIPEEWGKSMFPISGFQYLASPFSWRRWTLASFLLLTFVGGLKGLWIVYATIARDLRLIYRIIFGLGVPLVKAKLKNLTIPQIFEQTVRQNPDKTMITFISGPSSYEKMTFKEVDDLANQTGNYFANTGYESGQVVALMLENRVDHPSTWLGLSKVGIITALLNIHITGKALIHSIEITKARAIVYSDDTEEGIESIVDTLSPDVRLFKLSQKPPMNSALKARTTLIHQAIRKCSNVRPEVKNLGNLTDPLMYVFTSGTTGLPKAATIAHSRYLMTGFALYGMCAMDRKTDILYTMLPMYHTSANGLCTGAVIVSGMGMVCRKKFSASNYWKDCAEHGVTVSQYIGEVARYLINTPPSPYEEKQRVRMMFGNGMRADIFDQIRSRFNVDIAEFYVNFLNKKGAVGFVSKIFPFILPYRVIRIDNETGEFIRDPKSGLCQECEPGEVGELVSPIVRGNPIRDFQGYLDKSATSKKVAKNVLKQGDICFRSGDLMTMDDLGFLYFVDRFGDTFRWKGENVSTLEVETILSTILGFKDITVFGVQIPQTEGRACMVAMAMDEKNKTLDFEDLYKKVDNNLPSYARPIFLRICSQLEITSTYKFRKINLTKEGYDISCVKDKIYFRDQTKKTYSLLDQETAKHINSGVLQF